MNRTGGGNHAFQAATSCRLEPIAGVELKFSKNTLRKASLNVILLGSYWDAAMKLLCVSQAVR
jgi:hypothetical protein